MALTLTLGTIGITTTAAATAATAAAIGAGALGLGALGVAALAHRRGRGRRHRGRRQAEEEEAIFAQRSGRASDSLVLDEALALADILAADEEAFCGRRLVCELAQQEATAGNSDMAEILRFVREGDPARPGTGGLSADNPLLRPFQRAAQFGAGGAVCAEVFSQCTNDAMLTVRNLI